MESGKKILVGVAVLCIFIGFSAFVLLLNMGGPVEPAPVAVVPQKPTSEEAKLLSREDIVAELKRMNPDFDPDAKITVPTEKEILVTVKKMNPKFDPKFVAPLPSPEEIQATLKSMQGQAAAQ